MDVYRFSDFIKGYTLKTDKLYWHNIPEIFPASYAAKYVQKVSDEADKNYRIDVLDEIIPKQKTNLLSLHIRANDVLLGYKNGKYLWDKTRSDADYDFQPNDLEGFFSFLILNRPNLFEIDPSIKIYCNSHTVIDQIKFDLTNNLINDCRDVIKKFGFNSITSGETEADKVFFELCNSNILATTSGGFGKIANMLCRYRGGLVYECNSQ